jgi:sulfatase maturation enzyme AslB (radical SAM superfamily)
MEKCLPRIYAFETTNHCSAKCLYCPREEMKRPVGYAQLDTVRRVLDYMRNNNQKYIALHHMGEPLMHPMINVIIEMFAASGIRTELSTNGLLLPSEGKKILDAGVARVRIAIDHFYQKQGYLQGVADFLKLSEKYPTTEVRVHTIIGNDLSPFIEYTDNVFLEDKKFDNWAGAVEGESQLKKSKICYFLKYNYVVVTWDGRVIPCCMDYDAKYQIGDISEITHIRNKKCELCSSCAKMGFADGGEWTK